VLIVNAAVALVLPAGVTDVGLRAQVTPLITEEHVSATALLNPLIAAMLTVDVAELPGSTAAGEATVVETWKSGVDPDFMVKVSAPMCEMLPDTAETTIM
jgi:hypothetical protein